MQAGHICHIFNRGNNRQDISFCRENYKYFLRKVGKHLKPHLDVLAYCLMPNHFHFLVYLKEDFNRINYSKDLAVTLRSYTRGINKKYNRIGSLFQQHTKVKNITESANPEYYAFICFNYIHQNPVKAKLVEKYQDWDMSSFAEYFEPKNRFLCNIELASNLLNLPIEQKAFLSLKKCDFRK